MRILAFDIGGTHGRCALALPDGTSHNAPELRHAVKLARRKDESGLEWKDRLFAAGDSIFTVEDGLIDRVAVSFGGPVLPGGRVQSMHVAGWEKIALLDELQSKFARPVHIENDGNAGVAGEFYYGAGRGLTPPGNMIFMNVSTGIGGGLIINGRLLRGAHGLAGEFGHMVMDGSSVAPVYGKSKPGVLEALACGPAMAGAWRQALATTGGREPEHLDARALFQSAEQNDPVALKVLDAALSNLARGIAAAVCVADPEIVVIGGGVAQAGDVFFNPLREKLRAYLPPALESFGAIKPAECGDNAPLMGAVALATGLVGAI